MLKNFNLKARMLGSICSIAFVAFAITIAFVAVKASDMAKTEAVEKAEQIAYRYSGVVKAEIEVAMDAARTLSEIFVGLKKSGGVPDRKVLDSMLVQILEDNPSFLGVWTCWEPNALDGKDKEYVNATGHDATGRYIPYWNRNAAGVSIVDPLADYDKDGAGDYYQLSLRSGKETILDPYKYMVGGKEVLLTSVVSPIKYNGIVMGVTGVDFALGTFMEMVKEIRPFETGNAALIANNGTYVAHVDEARAGHDIGTSQMWSEAKTAIKSGKLLIHEDHSKSLKTVVKRVFVPVNTGRAVTPWSFLINIPLDKVLEKAHGIMYTSILIGILSFMVLLIVVYFMARGIVNPLRRITEGIGDGAAQVTSASQEVSSSSQLLAEGASEQAASIEETSSSLEEMSAMTKQNADHAREAKNMMKEAKEIIETANGSMSELTNSMQDISTASDETSKIIKTIDEIAFQTNLLALNAAVEAARAGEAGAGFAVVADEVRNLAMRAAEAAKNTSTLIEGTVTKVRSGSDLVAKTNDAFINVARSVTRADELVAEIDVASNEQAHGIGQVNTAVSEMDKVVQQNAATAEESASSAEEMNAQAEQMKGMIYELEALVEGSRKNGSTRRPSAVRRPRRQAEMKRPAGSQTQKRKDVDPKLVIPMGDNDFEDF